MLAEESHSKMLLKQQDPMVLEKKVNTTTVDYVFSLLSLDLKKMLHKLDLSVKHAFCVYVYSMNSSDLSPSCRPTKVEVPKELPKVSMVNTSLKKLKHHLAGFDVVVKERTTATSIIEGSWGFEHTKACFRDEIIPFVKALKDIFNTFDQYLIDELTECLKLKTELFNKKDFIKKETYDKLFGSYTTLEKHCISLEVDTQLNREIFERDKSISNQSAPSFDQYFELNELKAQSQEKDMVIRKLKERIKSLSGNMNKEKVKKDIEEIETINIELDHRVSKLIAENEHLKQTYKQLYDSIKPTRIQSKEQCDALINQVNQKYMEISYLFVQIVLWYLDSGCSKHMTGDRSQLSNFVNKFLGTIKFRNDHVEKILGYGDYQIGNVTISRVYYVEGLGYNLFSVGQFCDSNLEVAFRQHTCFIRNLKGVDLLTGS
ncbi:hypothetical protein Tco_1300449 [Tanacetum coccineum]